MSLVTNNGNVQQIWSVKSNAPQIDLKKLFTGIGQSVGAAYSKINQELFSGDVNLSSKKFSCTNNNLLKSTPVCRKEFSDLFNAEIENVSQSKNVSINELKSTFLKSVASSDYRITDIQSVQESIIKLIQTEDIKTLKQEAKQTLSVVEEQHTNVLKSELVTIIKESAIEIGFSNFEIISESKNNVVVVAEDKNGQAIVNEITTEKNLSINHSFETVGIVGDKCKIISKEFQEKLRAKGLKADQKESKATLGVPTLNSSKKIFEKFVDKKQNKQRARLLNQSQINIRK